MKQLKLFCLIIALLGLIAGNSVWARGGHGGGGHKGGKHFGGGHKGRRHFGGGHRSGRHLGGGYRGGRHLGGFGGFGGYGYRGYGYPGYGYGYPGYGYGYPGYGLGYRGGYGGGYPPVRYIQRSDGTQATTKPQADYWHYCSNPEGYYPHIKKCPGGWMQVVPQLSPPQ